MPSPGVAAGVGQALPLHHTGVARLHVGAHGHAPLQSSAAVIDGLGTHLSIGRWEMFGTEGATATWTGWV